MKGVGVARRKTTLTVLRTEQLTPHMVRLVLGDPGFDEFEASAFTDSYVKLLFADDVLRTYTIRSVDHEARELAIDFVVHGDEGVAGPWAANVAVGEQVSFYGPGGAYSPDPSADWHLLAGDASALPAIGAALAALPEGATAKVFVEGDKIDLPSKAAVELTWVPSGTLEATVRAAEWLPGRVHVFIHGEAETVMHGLRPYIRRERGIPADQASISGYWRRGRTEEGFRVWKRDLASTEAG